MDDRSPYQLMREKTGLLVIDFQERLAAAMPEMELEWTVANAKRLIQGAGILDLPIWVTEQYPKGIGPTLPELADVLPTDWKAHEKVDFSCVSVPSVMEAIQASGCSQIIVCGMEAHICVYQTARDLVQAGYQVFVPMDAVLSRAEENADAGLNLIERVGATITSTEIVLFDVLQRAGGPEFKKISALVK